MRIQNLKTSPNLAAVDLASSDLAVSAASGTQSENNVAPPAATGLERQALENALLKARIQHLELVIETARGLMGGNQERLLRRLHEAPREIATLSAQLRRIDPQAAW